MDDEHKVLLGNLFASQRCGVLATSGSGGPYTSLLAFQTSKDFRNVLFCTSRKTTKFAHILGEPRAAFLIDNRVDAGKDFEGAIAVTVLGKVEELVGSERVEFSALFLEKNDGLTKFLAQESTAMCVMRVEKYKVDQFAKSKEIFM